MILRSLRLVNFRGVRELSVRELAREGVVRVPVASDAEPHALADAIAFALGGDLPVDGPVMSRGEGFAYVEVGLRLPGDHRASVFRGLDRRGNAQVSLREAGGQRVTGGAEGVERRLGELCGGDVRALVHAASVSAAGDLRVARGDPTAAVTPVVAAARSRVESAIRDLSRALRAERLRSVAERRHADVIAVGDRLRRERATVAARIDRLSADRDGVRTSADRLAEYRSAAESQRIRAADAERARARNRGGGRLLEWGMATTSCALLALLAYVTTEGDAAFTEPRLRVYLGLAFLVATALYLVVLADRGKQSGRFMIVPNGGDHAVRPSATDPAQPSGVLRQRFPDLPAPDDPGLLGRLQAQSAGIDAELHPLRARLERVDLALARADDEATRSARALHLPAPAREMAGSGLQPDEGAEDAAREARECGDAAYQAAVERDALLADHAHDVVAARRVTDDALAALERALGDDAALASSRARLASVRAGTTDTPDEEGLCAQLLAEVAAVAAGTRCDGAPESDHRSALVAALSGGEFVEIARDAAGRDVLVRPDGARDDLAGVTPRLRARLELAYRVASAASGSGAGAPALEFVILDRLPAGLTDADLIAVVNAAAPGVRQILAVGAG